MPAQIGLVLQAPAKDLALVLTERKSACGGCRPTGGCQTCLSASKMKAKVHNRVGAQTGDVVEIHLDNRFLWQSAMVLYGFPVAGLMAGALWGGNVLERFLTFSDPSTAAVFSGLGGLVMGVAVAMAIGNSRYAKHHFIPFIDRIVTRAVPTGTASGPFNVNP